MHRLIHESSLHRVVVYVLDLLPHHLLVLDQLWMAALLPKLVGPVLLVLELVLLQLFEHTPGVLGFEIVDDRTGCERLEGGEFFGQIGRWRCSS
jgi:hypothetical protein